MHERGMHAQQDPTSRTVLYPGILGREFFGMVRLDAVLCLCSINMTVILWIGYLFFNVILRIMLVSKKENWNNVH
jgi:hypothetical protein